MITTLDIAGTVTAVTGFEKGSGKTTFLNHLLPLARTGGAVGAFTVGMDGAQKASASATPEIRVAEGDVVMTTEALARASEASFEVLAAVPGRSAMGRLLVGRARRSGAVTLVGSEHPSTLAEVVALVRAEGWARTILVDGAVNRLTPLGALGDVAFAFTARLDPANLARAVARMDMLAALADLPEAEGGEGAFRLEGPLTRETLARLPEGTKALSLGNFTDVFLEPAELTRLLERTEVTVRRRFHLLCLAVALRNLVPADLFRALRPATRERVLLNPYEAVS